MDSYRIFDGQLPETPLFHVYLCALRGKKALKVSVQAEATPTCRHASDRAVEKVLRREGAPESAFVAVYHDNPTPSVSGKHGAPMGRASGNLDHDSENWRASLVALDCGGYDKGGAYWGSRAGNERLYAVQDGMGNIAFVDACNAKQAIEKLRE